MKQVNKKTSEINKKTSEILVVMEIHVLREIRQTIGILEVFITSFLWLDAPTQIIPVT